MRESSALFGSFANLVQREFNAEVYLERQTWPTMAYCVELNGKCIAGVVVAGTTFFDTAQNEHAAVTIFSLVTDPEFRGQGVAKQLLRAAIDDVILHCDYQWMVRVARNLNGHADSIRGRYQGRIAHESPGDAIDPTQPVTRFIINLKSSSQ